MTKFRAPKLIGLFPYVVLYKFEDSGANTDFLLVPCFWFTNIGARSMLVEDVRLIIGDGLASPALEAHPSHTVPLEAIDSPNTFEEFDLLRGGLAPLSGLAVPPGERWSNNLAFSISAAHLAALRDTLTVSVEIRQVGKKRFNRILRQDVHFGRPEFSWLDWVGLGGPSAEYYYSVDSRKKTPGPAK